MAGKGFHRRCCWATYSQPSAPLSFLHFHRGGARYRGGTHHFLFKTPWIPRVPSFFLFFPQPSPTPAPCLPKGSKSSPPEETSGNSLLRVCVPASLRVVALGCNGWTEAHGCSSIAARPPLAPVSANTPPPPPPAKRVRPSAPSPPPGASTSAAATASAASPLRAPVLPPAQPAATATTATAGAAVPVSAAPVPGVSAASGSAAPLPAASASASAPPTTSAAAAGVSAVPPGASPPTLPLTPAAASRCHARNQLASTIPSSLGIPPRRPSSMQREAGLHAFCLSAIWPVYSSVWGTYPVAFQRLFTDTDSQCLTLTGQPISTASSVSVSKAHIVDISLSLPPLHKTMLRPPTPLSRLSSPLSPVPLCY